MKLRNADTLFLRIFLLLLMAVSISSFLAFEVFRATAPPPPWLKERSLNQSMDPVVAHIAYVAPSGVRRPPAPASASAPSSGR